MMMGGGPGHGRYEEARKAKDAGATCEMEVEAIVVSGT